jgi:hypothetical protein
MKEKVNHRLFRVTLRQLRALEALVRTGSTKGAAAALHVTPPAVTLQLRQLEVAVGGPLVERRPDGGQPTALGAPTATSSSSSPDRRSCTWETPSSPWASPSSTWGAGGACSD